MKPDWKDAPEWANWLAQDMDGQWYWYQFRPTLDAGIHGWVDNGGGIENASADAPDYAESLQERPQ